MEFVPCPPEMREQCRVSEAIGYCFEDVHHDFFPSCNYKTSVEKQFRELEVNKVVICRAIHNTIHSTQRSVEKPTRDKMLGAIHEEKENRKRSS